MIETYLVQLPPELQTDVAMKTVAADGNVPFVRPEYAVLIDDLLSFTGVEDQQAATLADLYRDGTVKLSSFTALGELMLTVEPAPYLTSAVNNGFEIGVISPNEQEVFERALHAIQFDGVTLLDPDGMHIKDIATEEYSLFIDTDFACMYGSFSLEERIAQELGYTITAHRCSSLLREARRSWPGKIKLIVKARLPLCTAL